MILVLLFLTALMLWMRDTTWQSVPGDALPVLAGLPIFLLLGRPWNLQREVKWTSVALAPFGGGLALMLVSFVTGWLFMGAAGWCLLLWAYLAPRLNPTEHSRIQVLLPLALLSFPWILLEGQPLGWYFRLSGATVTAVVCHLLGFAVDQQGTRLVIEGMPVSVEAACAGLNVLQALLLVGMILAVKTGRLKSVRDIPAVLCLLLAMAWCANTVRILAICMLGLTVGIPAAQSPLLHEGSGLLVLCILFGWWRTGNRDRKEKV